MAKINLLPWRAERRKQRQKQFYTLLGGVAIMAVLAVWWRPCRARLFEFFRWCGVHCATGL